MSELSAQALGAILALLIVVLLFVVFAATYWAFSLRVAPGERVVVFHFGKTRRSLVKDSGSRALALPLIDRAVHVTGELSDAWWSLHGVVPETWWIESPQRDEWSGEWTVRAGSPSGASEQRQAVGAGPSPAEALLALAAGVPEALRGAPERDGLDSGGMLGGQDNPAPRRHLRNPFRLPIHGNHFFVVPERWHDEGGPTNRGSRNDMLQMLDWLVTFGLPVIIVVVLASTYLGA